VFAVSFDLANCDSGAVLTATIQFNGKWQTLTICKIETLESTDRHKLAFMTTSVTWFSTQFG